MEITASMVRDLREKTGSGMMNCKNALVDCKGDMEEAINLLRKQGLAAASKKADRIAAEGLVAIKSRDTKAVVLELNAETDFVAKNEKFQQLIADLTNIALNFTGTLEDFKQSTYPNTSSTISDIISQNIAVIGENLNLRRIKHLSVQQGLVTTYVHNAVAEGMGKIGVLVALESNIPSDKLGALGKQIAMHIAASNPEALSVDQLDATLVEKEKAFVREQALATGKPPAVIDKMIEGRIRKFYEEVVLLEQTFILDGKTTISQMVASASEQLGGNIKITGFVRYSLGEGIDKKQEDFAAEVAAIVK